MCGYGTLVKDPYWFFYCYAAASIVSRAWGKGKCVHHVPSGKPKLAPTATWEHKKVVTATPWSTGMK